MNHFARRVFLIAGIYGLIVLVPQLFTESRIAHDYPPAITHPEYYYGFLGIAIAFQLVFLTIAKDPTRYRALMLPSVVEKLAFGVPAIVLYAQHRLSLVTLCFGILDLTLGALFLLSWRVTPPEWGRVS
ncbi:MAG: hypothetical protein M3Y30_07210 [Gemmatimonadota bacterium]|nr:hypothetical protein [Gemmatimonadota bacterium]